MRVNHSIVISCSVNGCIVTLFSAAGGLSLLAVWRCDDAVNEQNFIFRLGSGGLIPECSNMKSSFSSNARSLKNGTRISIAIWTRKARNPHNTSWSSGIFYIYWCDKSKYISSSAYTRTDTQPRGGVNDDVTARGERRCLMKLSRFTLPFVDRTTK